jgi:hypothetical protein
VLRSCSCVCFALTLLSLISAARAEPPAPQPAVTPPAASTTPPDFTQLRVDVEDGFGLHPWIYHEVRLSQRWGILGDVHAQTPGLNARFPAFLEAEVGPVLHIGPLQINPQIGIDLAWREGVAPDAGHTRAADVIPQLYLILAWNRIAAESWNLFFIPLDGTTSFYMMRQLVNVRVWRGLSVGPHVEGFFFFHANPNVMDRLAIGGDLLYAFRWGQLGLFLAYEKTRGVAETRLTFLKEL